MACYLRAWGTAFDAKAFVDGSSLAWDPVWLRGQRRRVAPPGRPERHEDSGVTTLAGPGDQWPAQVAGVIAFLRANEAEVARLIASPGVEDAVLDFGVHWHDDLAAMFFRFPQELLKLAGAAGLELELSVYDARDAAAPDGGDGRTTR